MTNGDRSPAVERREIEQVERTWTDPPGFFGWFTHVDHKSLGKRYIVTAFVFFMLAGTLAATMRLRWR